MWLSIWEEINTRRADANQTITTQDYRYFTEGVGNIGPTVIRQAIAWSNESDSSRKQLGGAVLFSQVLKPILSSIDKIKTEHPEATVDEAELIQDGIVSSVRSFERFSKNSSVQNYLDQIGENTYRKGQTMLDPSLDITVSELSSTPHDELERGEFVGANLDSEIDPQKEAEEAELKNVLDEGINSLTPRQQNIIKERYSQLSTLEEIGEKHNITGSRVRQIIDKALRILRHPKFRKRIQLYDTQRTARLQQDQSILQIDEVKTKKPPTLPSTPQEQQTKNRTEFEREKIIQRNIELLKLALLKSDDQIDLESQKLLKAISGGKLSENEYADPQLKHYVNFIDYLNIEYQTSTGIIKPADESNTNKFSVLTIGLNVNRKKFRSGLQSNALENPNMISIHINEPSDSETHMLAPETDYRLRPYGEDFIIGHSLQKDPNRRWIHVFPTLSDDLIRITVQRFNEIYDR